MNMQIRLIFIFTLAAFCIGLSEFIIIGIVGNLIEQLNLTLSQVGLFISIYALGISLGAPILTVLTRNTKAKILFIILLLLFSIFNILLVSTKIFYLLLLFRACSGIIHGIFFSVASAEIPSLISQEKASLAIALMFSGLTIAMVIGVPASMYVVQLTDWHSPFIIIALISFIASLLIIKYLPTDFGYKTSLNRKFKVREILNFKMIGLYIITFFGFGGGFYFYSYIEPWLTQVNKMTIYQASISFIIIGIGSLLGNILGGLLPQKFKINLIFYSILILQISSLIIMNFKINFYITQLALFLWSVSTFSIAPIVQTLAISNFTSIYPRISASFNVAAFNLGISFSSYISTLNIDSFGLEQLPIGAIFLIILSLPIVYIIFNLSNKNISLISSK